MLRLSRGSTIWIRRRFLEHSGKNILFVCLQDIFDCKIFKDKMGKIKKLLLSKLPTRVLLIGPSRLLSILEGPEVLGLAQAPHSFPFPCLWIDPINWSAFKEAFHDWSDKNCPNLTITQVIDTRFCERLSPSHSPRSW